MGREKLKTEKGKNRKSSPSSVSLCLRGPGGSFQVGIINKQGRNSQRVCMHKLGANIAPIYRRDLSICESSLEYPKPHSTDTKG